MSLEEQLKEIGIAELVNVRLVMHGIRNAMLIQPTDYNECLPLDPKTLSVLIGINKYYPDLKFSDFGVNGILVAKREYSKEEIYNDETVGDVLGYPYSKEYNYILANRDHMQTISIEVNLYLKKDFLNLPIPIQLFLNIARDTTHYFTLADFADDATACLKNDPFIGFIIDRIVAEVRINIPPKSILDKIIKKEPITDDIVDEIKNFMYNIGFSEKLQSYNFEFDNPCHLGVIATIISFYICNPINAFNSIQKYSAEKDLYKIIGKWEQELIRVLNTTRCRSARY